MATHGKLPEFDASTQSWSLYTERLEYYFEANDLQHNEAKKKAILLTCCGATTYELLKNLLQPEKPADKTYDALVRILDKHFNPKPSQIMQRYRFNTRHRQPGETVATYVAQLKKLGEHCNFHSLEEMVRDRLVCGIADGRIQRRLLQEPDLDYQKALDIALAMELANQDITHLQQQQHSTHHIKRVHQTPRPSHKPTRPTSSPCYRCGADNHTSDTCKFKIAECRYCKKIGHIAKVCKSKLRQHLQRLPGPQQQPFSRGAKPPDRRTLHQTNLSSPSTSLSQPPSPQQGDETYTLFNTVGGGKPLLITVNVNKVDIQMELDTGAAVSVISEIT